jgi:hypothetical protein
VEGCGRSSSFTGLQSVIVGLLNCRDKYNFILNSVSKR